MGTAVEGAASADVGAKHLSLSDPFLTGWSLLFLAGWSFFLAGQSFSLPSLSMTTIANLTLCLAHHDVLSALMLVIQAPCYRQNTWYGSHVFESLLRYHCVD